MLDYLTPAALAGDGGGERQEQAPRLWGANP
jgi:hypothetical protein